MKDQRTIERKVCGCQGETREGHPPLYADLTRYTSPKPLHQSIIWTLWIGELSLHVTLNFRPRNGAMIGHDLRQSHQSAGFNNQDVRKKTISPRLDGPFPPCLCSPPPSLPTPKPKADPQSPLRAQWRGLSRRLSSSPERVYIVRLKRSTWFAQRKAKQSWTSQGIYCQRRKRRNRLIQRMLLRQGSPRTRDAASPVLACPVASASPR